jgi:hypothetical protein
MFPRGLVSGPAFLGSSGERAAMSKYPREGLKGAIPADLHWLSGRWMGRHGEGVVEEYWSPLGAGTLMAMLRWQKDDRVFFYELMAIERDAEQLALRIKHFDPGLRGWEEKQTS